MEILILDPQRLGRGRFGRRGQVDEEPVAGGLVPALARHSPTLLRQTKSHSNVGVDDATGINPLNYDLDYRPSSNDPK